MDVKAVVYDGSSVTSPKNWNNPKFGDPCYSLHTDSRNYVVICFEPGIAKREGGESRFVINKSTTLRAEMGDNKPAICYAIVKLKDDGNPHNGIHKTSVSSTLDLNGANPNCEQGGC